jgi:hypothetical protein
MTLLAMLPNNNALISDIAQSSEFAQYLPYIQFASNFGRNSLLRVDAAAGGDQYEMYGLCDCFFFSTVGICDSLGSFEPGIAEWTNHYTSARQQHANNNSQPAIAETLGNNSAGFMRAKRNESCP